MPRTAALVFAAFCAAGVGAQTQAPVDGEEGEASPPVRTLRPLTVSTPRGAAPLFEMPVSVDVVDGDALRDGRLQVNLSEGLGAVPGLQLQNRQSYAQDLQLSVRGFGARSTFGVRGVRIYVDGIPATLPDGQGQTSNIDLASADRIEVLRGPFSALYGNSSGGVVQVFTADGQSPPRAGASLAAGSFGTLRESVGASGVFGPMDAVLSGSHFETDGWRAHSDARRDIANGKLNFALDDAKLSIIVNAVRIRAQDPLGLTEQQYRIDPRAAPLATQFDTRKDVDQWQSGLHYERRINADNDLRLMLYTGDRQTLQFQAIPPAAQQNPQQAGGVIDLGRGYGGLDARWITRTRLGGRPFELSTGLAYDTLAEDRKGFENYLGSPSAPVLGVQGRLRRDERNHARNLDPYVQAVWRMAERWSLETGLRYSTVRFESQDHYIRPGNGDDSGSVRYERVLPVAALRYAFSDALSLYGAYGRGYETPTLNELSYRPDGRAGLNFALQPSVNDSIEFGAKARLTGGWLTAALFQTRTDDEIVTDTNLGGRATFRNAGRTRRDGVELAWTYEAGHWRTQLAATWLRARYLDAFCSPSPCGVGTVVPAGNQIPGIAPQMLFASLGWVPPEGWRAGAELRAVGRIQANDRNTAQAPGYAVMGLYAGYQQRSRHWEWNVFARIDNVFDRRYIGSVIVNEGNGRYFEPAPGRNWTVGGGAAYGF